MAKTVGIDVGDYSIKAIELDGSYKRVRLLRCRVEPVPEAAAADPALRAGTLAATIRRALKEGHISGTDLRLGHPCREAVLRTVEVPFSGHEAIRKVIKAEVEGSIHSHTVDDMVVDFHEIGKSAEGSKVLVAAVPKPGLRSLLTALEEHKIEPEVVDLDVMALYRVAQWCGAFEVAAAPSTDAALPAIAGAVGGNQAPPVPRLCAVLDLGSHSTRVLLVEDGELVDMRALRVGDAAVAEELATKHGISIDVARQAVATCVATGGAFQTEVAVQPPAVVGEGAAPAPAAARSVTIEPAAVAAAQTALLQRLARELTRFLASVRAHNKISDLWITGGATQLAGMREMLQEVFGIAPRDLDVIGRLQHSLPEEEAAMLAPQIATAVGLALGGLGGVEGFNFRQEDLAFTRGYDRIKFPLAIFCMVALFTMLVWGFKLNTDLKLLEHRVGCTVVGGDAKKPKFWGMVLQVLDSGWFAENFDKAVENASTVEGKDQRVRLVKLRELLQQVAAAPVEERLVIVKNRLSDVAKALQSKVGVYEDLTVESGLAVLVRFAEVLKQKEPELGRFLLMRLKLNLPPHSGRALDFTVAFRGNDFRAKLSILRQALHDECAKADSPFKEDDDKSFKETRFADGKESGVEGSYYDLRLVVRDEFKPFGPAAPRVGQAAAPPRESPGALAQVDQEGGR